MSKSNSPISNPYIPYFKKTSSRVVFKFIDNLNFTFQCFLSHTGHLMDEYTYNSYRTNRDLNEQDLELLEQFSRVGAKPANVANILTETRHTNYSTKDANNLLKIVRQKVKCPFNLFYSLLGTYRSYTYGALAPEMTSHVKFPCAFPNKCSIWSFWRHLFLMRLKWGLFCLSNHESLIGSCTQK